MSVTRIIDSLGAVAERRAKRSPDGTGFARTKDASVRYTRDHLIPGMDHIESVRFIQSPMIKPDDSEEKK